MGWREVAKFVGGEKLTAYLADLRKKLEKQQTLQVGFLEGRTYPDGTPVAMIAAIQEFGAPAKNIPPRPFFRNMIAQHKDEWGGELSKVLVAANYDPETALKAMGREIVGQLQDSIDDTNAPPNAPATIAAKGGASKPLVDTGEMRRSIDSRVVDGTE